MAFLLLAAQSVSAADAPLPMRLTLVAEADRTGVLRYVTRRYEIVDPKGKAGRVEAKPVATGFELSFVGTIPSAGRVEVTLNLTLTLPKNEKKPGRRPTRTEQFNVATTFEAADGESVLIPGTKNGPAIVVTPRIVADSLGPEAVLLEVMLPLGGREVSLPAQRLLKSSDLAGVEDSKNSIREAAGHSFVTGVSEGTAILTTLESGAELTAMISAEEDTGVGLEITVGRDLVDEPVATATVFIDGLSHDLELPVARSLTVDTVATLAAGQTLALAGILTGDADGTEIIIFATPNILEDAPVRQAVVEARIALLGGGGNEIEPVDGATERTRTLKELTAEASEPDRARLVQRATQRFVVGDQEGETVAISVNSETTLEFSPRTLAPGELLLGIDLSAVSFAPEPPRFPLNTTSGITWVELPETRIVELKTNVALHDGETIAMGGGLLQRVVPGNREDTEMVFLGTADVVDGVVRFEGQLIHDVRQQSSEPEVSPDNVEYQCTGSFRSQSKTGPDGVEHSVVEGLQCLMTP
jgi:hypothetical protein